MHNGLKEGKQERGASVGIFSIVVIRADGAREVASDTSDDLSAACDIAFRLAANLAEEEETIAPASYVSVYRGERLQISVQVEPNLRAALRDALRRWPTSRG